MNNDVITYVEYLAITDEEIMAQSNNKRKLILKEFKDVVNNDSTRTIHSLIKEEFKYIRLNIEDKFIVEGKLKIEYGITQDDNDLGVVSVPNVLNMTMFKSIYSGSDVLMVSDVIQEIFDKYKAKRCYVYSDTKENYLKEFLNAYVKNIQNVFEMLMYCVDDTIEFKKFGNIVQIKTYNTVDNSLKYQARELVSKELFNSIDELKPKKYLSIQELIDLKPIDIDYKEVVELENNNLLDKIKESFDEQYDNDPTMVEKRQQIIDELYEKMKLNY